MTPAPLQQFDADRLKAKRKLRFLWLITLANTAALTCAAVIGFFVLLRTGQSMSQIERLHTRTSALESHAGKQDLAIYALAQALKLTPPPELQQQTAPNQTEAPTMKQIKATEIPDDEIQTAVNSAEFWLLIESARAYGLIKGGPDVNVERCEEILAEGKRRGVTPAKDPRYGRTEPFVVPMATDRRN